MSCGASYRFCGACGKGFEAVDRCPEHNISLDFSFLKPDPFVAALAKTRDSLKRFIITDSKGNPYLERIVLEKDRTYLHIIYKSDDDREPHNHPWAFTSYILHGTYIDHRFHVENGKLCPWLPKTHGPGSVNSCETHEYHRLELVDGPVVTLVQRQNTTQGWGFWVEGEGHVDSEIFLDRKFGKGNWNKEYE